MNKFAFFVLIIATFTAGWDGLADDTAAEQAEALFIEGNQLFEQQKFPEAARAFREAMKARPSWRLHFNIAQSEAAAKNYDLAYDEFELYLSEGGDAISNDRETEVFEEMKRLKLKVGNLALAAPDGADVSLDGNHRGTTPLPGYLRLAAGRNYQLLVTLGDQILLDRTVRIGSEETLEITVGAAESDVHTVEANSQDEPQLDKTAGESSAPAATTHDNTSRRLKIAAWSLTGAGAAMLLAGAITGGITLTKADDLETDCSSKTCTATGADDRYLTAKKLAITTDILLVTGGISAATGLTLLLWRRHRHKSEQAAPRILPVADHRSVAIMLEGSF